MSKETTPQETPKRPRKKRRKAFWTKQFYLWHWVSSAICLAAMLLFAFTGITLNHAADIDAEPKTVETTYKLSEDQLSTITFDGESDTKKTLPDDLAKWLTGKIKTPLKNKPAEWTEYEIYLSLPRPGGDAWLLIDRETGEITHENTDRGTISFLNDLHKGRHTGTAWSWFLDIFSGAAVIFCLTGLGLLFVHARRRPSTWPVVAAGILIPLIIIIFFLH